MPIENEYDRTMTEVVARVHSALNALDLLVRENREFRKRLDARAAASHLIDHGMEESTSGDRG